MKKILLTGFEPFDIHIHNSSQILAQILSQELNMSHLILPVSYKRSLEMLNSHLDHHQYDFILMLGLAADREKVCLERVGLNLRDARIQDADGILAIGERIDSAGEGAIFSQLPLSQWIEDSEMLISNSAGSYVCNFLYYKILQGNYGKKSLFVHLPQIQNLDQKNQIKKDLRRLIQRISEEL